MVASFDHLNYGDTWKEYGIVSVDTPDFIAKRAAGTLPYNPHTLHQARGLSPLTSYPGGSERIAFPRHGFNHAVQSGTLGSQIGDPVPFGMGLEEYHQLAAARLRSKVNSAALDGGLNLGEYREVANLVRDALVSTAAAVRAVRRGDARGVIKAFGLNKPPREIAANAWLGYQYAIKPLVSDVHTAVTLLEDGLRLDPVAYVSTRKTFVVHGKARVTLGSFVESTVASGTIRVSGKLKYRVTNPVLATLSALGLSNPAYLAWNLLPLSFVVDWFYPVSEFLLQFGPPAGVSFVGGYTYVKAEGSAYHLKQFDAAGETVRLSGQGEELFKDRRPFEVFHTPKVNVPDLSLSKAQVASGMALLSQAFSK